MLSSSFVKYINSLNQKKYRNIHNAFVAEGMKSISEVIKSDYEILHLFYTKLPSGFDIKKNNAQLITDQELKKISNLNSPNDILAVCKIKSPNQEIQLTDKLSIVLDDINDPGNFGTIIRLADWFGIENIICSLNSVDLYNPKVIQSTKGSFTRVNILYKPLDEVFSTFPGQIFGTYLEGTSIYDFSFPKKGLIVFGNEANGISKELEKYISDKINIPKLSLNKNVESLNLAMATAIVLGEISSQQLKNK